MAYHAENAKELDLLVTAQQAYEFVEASIDTLRFWKAHVIKAYINPDTDHPGPTPVDPAQGAVELEIPTQELASIIETALGLKAAAQWNDKQYAAAAQTIVNAIYGRWS